MPSSTKSLAPPALADAERLELQQHDVGEAVVDLQEVDVGRRTPAMAKARGRGTVEPELRAGLAGS